MPCRIYNLGPIICFKQTRMHAAVVFASFKSVDQKPNIYSAGFRSSFLHQIKAACIYSCW